MPGPSPTPRASRLRGLVAPVALVAAVGVVLAVGEIARLRHGGFSSSPGGLAGVVIGHLLLALVVGGPIALALARSRRPPLRIAPALVTIFVLSGLLLNLTWLPEKLAPLSLVADAALALAVVGLGMAFVRRPWGRRGDALAAGAVAAACVAALVASAPARPRVAAAPDAGAQDLPDVFVLLVDTLRADHVGAYGYPRATTPSIDALAAEGVVFSRAYSTSNWTRPALASLHTSTMPSRHGMAELDRGLPPRLTLLAEQLQARGYRTGMLTIGGNFEPVDGYSRGADYFWVSRLAVPLLSRCILFQQFVFRDFPSARALAPASAVDYDTASPEVITDHVLEFVRQADRARPVFVFAHYLGPHDPYTPPPPFDHAFGAAGVVARTSRPPTDRWAGPDALSPDDRQQMIDQYDGEVRWHDDSIGRLLGALRREGRLEHAVVVVVADHGEGFGEHGAWAHAVGLFDEIVRIPLVVWTRPALRAAHRVEATVSLLDVAPTLLELAGLPPPDSFDGESLVPWLRGEGHPFDRAVHTENASNGERSVRTREWAYLEESGAHGPRRWLYRTADVAQEREVSAHERETAEELAALARGRRADDTVRAIGAPRIVLDEPRQAQLRTLGYLDE